MGWISGCTRPEHITANEQGVSADHSFFLPALEGGLEKYLAALRADTYQDFLDSYNACASVEELDEKEEAIVRCNALIKRAWNYLLDFSDEISNGEAALLKIDPDATEKHGIPHYTIRSIERWAKTKYPNDEAILSSSRPETEGPSPGLSMENCGDCGERKEPNSRTVDSLKTTLAFLVEAFADASTSEKYRHPDGRPNVTAISNKLEELARKASKDSRFAGQGQESIRKRIDDAMNAKRKLLEER